ncbi:universal stress protein [Natronobacterium gregoryi]|uniref:Universal stress protein n=2 Tax=Natronobacterium gregoryi TaxID=44930 RepID=L0AFK6_NATGS|nr:universal stress protein [Natronobacterium gregoryi]AFZ71845.1 universal stress protein UspA-like protein [Natronobacterium gregoryi SP2]ELY72981.1 UspA domain-containing protein [Natronobacterium gregoryi SP2]PLK19124.1 universal stress protein [Natronobacterium gregoryi SP2]SFJ60107.1 Nucleotide-binding universal stress protein, UspA family [Natronobacterium gregoryi]
MYDDVLIPTDGSDDTRRSIEHGLALAAQFDATVHTVAVVPEGPLGTLEDESAVSAAQRAAEYVAFEAKKRDVDVVTAVEQGVPHEIILKYTDEQGIDAIVMGTQGRTGLDRVLVGSVTERVVRMAETPVVTVRLTDEIRIDDEAEAERLAREALADRGDDGETPVADDLHQISGTWLVPFETDTGTLRARVDGVTGAVALESVE